MKLTKDNIVETLKKYKAKFEEFEVVNLWLFGSYLQEKQTKDSDIDFLVEFKDNTLKKGYKTIKLSVFIEQLFNTKIDIGEKRLLKEGYREHILNNEMLKIIGGNS